MFEFEGLSQVATGNRLQNLQLLDHRLLVNKSLTPLDFKSSISFTKMCGMKLLPVIEYPCSGCSCILDKAKRCLAEFGLALNSWL